MKTETVADVLAEMRDYFDDEREMFDTFSSRIQAAHAQDATDAALWRKAQEILGELWEAGEMAGTTQLCACYLAARAHQINAEKAEFKLENLTNMDGEACGDWIVTIKRAEQ